MSRTLIIAECGSCHDGHLEKAYRLIDAAVEAGADVAKFQFWSSPQHLAERRRAAAYREAYERYRLPERWLRLLSDYCTEVGIEFMCSTYLPEDIEVVSPFVQRFKVASFEARDTVFLAAHAPFLGPKQLLISGGMGITGDEIVGGFQQGQYRQLGLLKTLHCVSAYPAPIEELDLASIRHGGHDGFSDHSGQVLTGYAAVCAGASIVEVHLRLDDTDRENPDAGPHALTPEALGHYVALIREAEEVMGEGWSRQQPSETEMSRYLVRA